MTVYLGVDPTAASLHIGSLLPVICLNKFIEHGHKVILLMGDGTAIIGDPSGKKNERPMLSNESVDINKNSIEAQLKRLVPGAIIKYNSEWLQGLSYMGFLRTVGKHISVNYMRAKDSVRAREEDGISYAEFSYMLLQGATVVLPQVEEVVGLQEHVGELGVGDAIFLTGPDGVLGPHVIDRDVFPNSPEEAHVGESLQPFGIVLDDGSGDEAL
jgi:tyrosyl-tRNA synthetase